MRTFKQYNLELTTLEELVANKKKSIQERNERRAWRLDSKFFKFLNNSFILGEDEQVKYRDLMESGLSKKKQRLKEQEKKALEVQNKKIDDFKNNNWCEHRIYEILKGVIDDEEEEKKIYEKEIGTIQIMIEQLKKELKLKKLEQEVVNHRKNVLELLDIELWALNQIRADYKRQLFRTFEDTIGNENESAVQLTAIQEGISLLEKKIAWLEKQLRSKKIDYKQILKELEWISSEDPKKEKEMIEALKYAEIWILIRKLKEPLQDLMDKYGVWKEFLRNLCRYLRNEWKLSRGVAFLDWEENIKLKISEKHINHWKKKYWADFIQYLVQLLREEWIEVIQEKSKDEDEDKKEIQKSEINNQPISSEENKKRRLIEWLENSSSISDSVSILKYLWFRFLNEKSFINQVIEAQNEWLKWVVENINILINKRMEGSSTWTIAYRKSKKKWCWYRIALNCNGRNPRILLKKDEEDESEVIDEKDENWKYTIVCVAPHDDYENILLWQTKNYFQTWKWNWMERGENWWKKWRA